MKIRMDFVTNSSSSSFTLVNIDNDILKELKDRYGIVSNGEYMEDTGSLSFEDTIADFVLSLNTNSECRKQIIAMESPCVSLDEFFDRLLSDELLPEEEDDNIEDDEKLQKGLQYIREHRDEINAATRSATIEYGYCVSDDWDSSYWQYMTFKKGTVNFYSLDADDWDPVKGDPNAGSMLAQMLFECTSVANNLKPFAEKIGHVYSRKDPYYTEKDYSLSFDQFDSFSGKIVCLTGDFKYGSKQDVEAYVKEKGGTIVSSVTKACNMVLVGALGSKAWSHNNYGTKVEKAIKQKAAGSNISIVKEEDAIV